MSRLFAKPKPVQAPVQTQPEPKPPAAVADVSGAGEFERKQLRRKGGFKETFLTGDLIPKTRKKQFLG